MEIRQARGDELPELKRRLNQSGGEIVDLDSSRVWVAVEDGILIGMLSARMVFQIEPMLIFPECRNKITCSRAGLGMYRAASAWLGDRERNRTGIYWFFAITRSKAVMNWAERLGWHEQYVGATTFIKYL